MQNIFAPIINCIEKVTHHRLLLFTGFTNYRTVKAIQRHLIQQGTW